MYGWLWRHLPGPAAARALAMAVLAAVVLLACARWGFPALAEALTPEPALDPGP